MTGHGRVCDLRKTRRRATAASVFSQNIPASCHGRFVLFGVGPWPSGCRTSIRLGGPVLGHADTAWRMKGHTIYWAGTGPFPRLRPYGFVHKNDRVLSKNQHRCPFPENPQKKCSNSPYHTCALSQKTPKGAGIPACTGSFWAKKSFSGYPGMLCPLDRLGIADCKTSSFLYLHPFSADDGRF